MNEKRVSEKNIKDVISRVARYNGLTEEAFLLRLFEVYEEVRQTFNDHFFNGETPVDIASPTVEYLNNH